jgi:hypothetical protein
MLSEPREGELTEFRLSSLMASLAILGITMGGVVVGGCEPGLTGAGGHGSRTAGPEGKSILQDEDPQRQMDAMADALALFIASNGEKVYSHWQEPPLTKESLEGPRTSRVAGELTWYRIGQWSVRVGKGNCLAQYTRTSSRSSGLALFVQLVRTGGGYQATGGNVFLFDGARP